MKTGRCRCVVALLLFVAGAINYMDRAALGVVAPISNKELSLSPSEPGIVFSSFFFDYSIFAFIGGHQLISASRNLDDDRLRVFRLNRWERATAGPLVGLIEVAYGWCTSFVIVAARDRLDRYMAFARDRQAGREPLRPRNEREMIEASRSAIHPAEAGNDSMPLRSYLMPASTLPLGVGLFGVNYTLFVFISRMRGYFTNALHRDIRPMSVLSAVPWAWWHRLVWRRPDRRRLLQARKGQAARSRRQRQMLVARHCMKAARRAVKANVSICCRERRMIEKFYQTVGSLSIIAY
jgi:hypothetical protein